MSDTEKLPFPCFRCGACCLNLEGSKDIEKWATKEGHCRYYNPDERSCSIYDKRPKCCNVEAVYEKFYKENGVSWEDFVYTNMLNCCLLRYLNEMPEPPDSLFYDRQEDVAAVLIQDMIAAGKTIKKDFRSTKENNNTQKSNNSIREKLDDARQAQNNNTNSQDVEDVEKTEEIVDTSENLSKTKRERIQRPEIPLEERELNLDVPDLGDLMNKTKMPKAGKKNNPHKGSLL